MKQIQLTQGARSWSALINPKCIHLVEPINQAKSDLLSQKARILVDGNWLTTDETVQHILDLIQD